MGPLDTFETTDKQGTPLKHRHNVYGSVGGEEGKR